MLTFQVNNVLSKIVHIALSHYSTKKSDHVVPEYTRVYQLYAGGNNTPPRVQAPSVVL